MMFYTRYTGSPRRVGPPGTRSGAATACGYVPLLLAGCAILGACSAGPPIRSPDTYTAAQAYPVVLQRYTAEARLYQDFETRLQVTATLLTESWQHAYRDEYARAYRLRGPSQGATPGDLVPGPDVLEAIAWVASSDSRYQALEPDKNVWRLALFDRHGKAVGPTRVSLIRRPSVEELHFFPYLDRLGRAYRVTFPLHTGEGQVLDLSGPLHLQFAGSPGTTELTWHP